MAEQENQNNQPKPGPQGENGKKPRNRFSIYWIYALVALIFIGIQYINFGTETKDIDWNDIRRMVANQDIAKLVVINNKYAEVFIKPEKIKEDTLYKDFKNPRMGGETATGPHFKYKFLTVDALREDLKSLQEELVAKQDPGDDPELLRKLRNDYTVLITAEERRDWGTEMLGWFLPILILVVAWIFIMRMMSRGGGAGGQIFNIGKSKAQLFDKTTSVSITFNDVAGLEEAKVEVMEIVDFLKNPKRYTDLGGKIPKGALLVGPPGTGKTLLAKAVAGEAKVPFFSISGSDFVEMFVGVGASRVRDLFKQAKEKAPCIIFIDEIDAIGRARGKNAITGANDERENTLNQLLTEMDGFATNTGVIILAATNRADILDRALLRAGRFDRQIHVELPDIKEREAIFKVHMRPLKLDDSVRIDFLSKQTPGFSGADIANVCNEAALIAARKGKSSIGKQDFLDAIDRIVGGLEKRNKIISLSEKRVIAFHEAGHATVSWLLEHAHPLVKVTIVPRGKALGAAWYLPEERQITTFEQMFDEMTSALGGRASEQVMFGKVSTGALNDLEKVTKQAYAMVVYFGLNEKVGNLSYYDSSGQQEYAFTKPYSEETARTIDEEIHKLVEAAYDRAIQILTENKEKLEALAGVLLEREVIFREDLEAIFGKRPYDSHDHDLPAEEPPVKEIPETVSGAENTVTEVNEPIGMDEGNDTSSIPD
ncbi:MAG: ATP-dependent zinc metalloprotease FtsH [Lentimicrobiaceae bacterium]|nr:ATP-dependent zinc metalloprotease FtsH [Lentimicrobiaceae bacterium]